MSSRPESIGQALRSGCEHSESEARYQKNAAQARMYADQCLKCGARTSEWIALREILAPEMSSEWDWSLAGASVKDFLTRTQAESAARQKAAERDWWDWYSRYLESPPWKERRELVMRRAGGMCEGCGIRSASQVHHRTYERIGREMLFDLAAICDDCHEEIHNGVAPLELQRIEARRKP